MEKITFAAGPVRCMFQPAMEVEAREVEFVAEDRNFIAYRDLDGERLLHLDRREKFRFERDAPEVSDHDVDELRAPPVDTARVAQVFAVFKHFEGMATYSAATLTLAYFVNDAIDTITAINQRATFVPPGVYQKQ